LYYSSKIILFLCPFFFIHTGENLMLLAETAAGACRVAQQQIPAKRASPPVESASYDNNDDNIKRARSSFAALTLQDIKAEPASPLPSQPALVSADELENNRYFMRYGDKFSTFESETQTQTGL
jgi:hypothetical protein